MKTINFYLQVRVDGGKRTGVEMDGETVLEQFEPGNQAEDSALLWFVDVRCSGNTLPEGAEAVRSWLIENAPAIQAGLSGLARKLEVGVDFSAPIMQPVANAGPGINIQVCCSALRRLTGLEVAQNLKEIGARWTELLEQLETLEPLAR